MAVFDLPIAPFQPAGQPLGPQWQLQPAERVSLLPALVVGFGPTGEAVLRRLKKNLIERGGGQMPQGVTLFWMGTEALAEPRAAQHGVALDANESVLSAPDFEALQSDLRGQGAGRLTYLNWWQNNALHDAAAGRLRGRMAFFWEKDFQQNRILTGLPNRFLENTKDSPPGTPRRIYIAASPAEIDASMAMDFLHWLHGADNPVPATLWFYLPALGGEVDESAQRSRRTACLRELARFSCGQASLLKHSADIFEPLVESKLFEGIYLFDQPSSPAAMADSILTLLDPAASTYIQQIQVNDAQEGMGKVSIFTWQQPRTVIRGAVAACWLSDVLFANQPPSAAPPGAEVQQQVLNLLDNLPDRNGTRYPYKTLASLLRNNFQNQRFPPLQLDLQVDLRWRLKNALNRWNQEHSPALGHQLCLLRTLHNNILDACQVLGRIPHHANIAPLVGQGPLLAGVIKEFIAQLEQWMPSAQRIYQNLQGERAQANAQLAAAIAGQQDALGRLLMRPAAHVQQGAHEGPADCYYRDQLYTPEGRDIDASLRQRIAWQWDFDHAGRVGLYWNFAGIVYQQFPGDPPRQGRYLPYQADELNRVLHLLGGRFAASIESRDSVCDYLERLQAEDVLQPILDAPDQLDYQPRVAAQRRDVAWLIGGLPGTQGNDAHAYLTHLANMPEFKARTAAQVISTDDSTRCTFLRFEVNFPRQSSRLLDSDLAQYVPNPRVHVFADEQNAVAIEQQIHTTLALPAGKRHIFSPAFVRLMPDREAFEAVMQCLFWGWIMPNPDRQDWSLRVPGPGQAEISLRSHCDNSYDLERALEDILLKLPNALNPNPVQLGRQQGRFQETIAQIRRILGDYVDKPIHGNIEERIERWQQHNPTIGKDLAFYQRYLLSIERNRRGDYD